MVTIGLASWTGASNGSSAHSYTPDVGVSLSQIGAGGLTVSNVSGTTKVYPSALGDSGGYGFTLVRPSYPADYTVAAAIDLLTDTTHQVRLFARYIDANNYYKLEWQVGADTIKLWKRVSGSDTQLATYDASGVTVVAAHVLKLSVQSNVIKGYRNGTEILSATDGALSAAGQAGMVLVAAGTTTNILGDDFTVQSFEAGPTVVTGSMTVYVPSLQRAPRGRPMTTRAV
jgi:hypothetical protein